MPPQTIETTVDIPEGFEATGEWRGEWCVTDQEPELFGTSYTRVPGGMFFYISHLERLWFKTFTPPPVSKIQVKR